MKVNEISEAERKVMLEESYFDYTKMKYPLVSGRWVQTLLGYIENLEEQLKEANDSCCH